MEKKEREEILELTEDMVVDDDKGKKVRRVVITILIILVACFLGFWAWWSIETAKIAKSVAETGIPKRVLELEKQFRDFQVRLDEMKAKLKEIESIAEEKEKEALAAEAKEKATKEQERRAFVEILNLATPKEGEGIESTFIRQLIANPHLLEGDKKLIEKYPQLVYRGDINDKEGLKKWTGTSSNILAVLLEYYDWKFGGEVRVKYADKVAYRLVIGNDGKLLLQVYVKDKDGNFPTEPQLTQKLAKDFSSAKFKADIPGGIQSWEYPFIGQ